MGTGWRRAFCTTIRRDQPSHGGPAPMAIAASTCSDADSDADGSSTGTTTTTTVVPLPAAGAGGAPMASSSPRSHSRLSFFSLAGGSGLSKCKSGSTSTSSSASRVLPPATASEPASPVLRCRTGKTKTAEDDGATPSAAQMNPPAVTATVSAPCSPRPPSPFAALRNTLRLSRRSCGVCLQSVKAVRGTAIFIAECSHAYHFPCISTHVRKQRKGGQLLCPVCSAAWCQAPLLSFHPHGGLDDDGTATTDPPETSVPAPAAAEASDSGPWSQAIKQSSSAAEGGSRKLLPPVPPAVEQDIISKLTVKTAVTKKSSTGKDGDRVSNVSSKSSAGTGAGEGVLAAIKPYNDDEPLLTPGGSRFNPIPEAAEEYDGCDDPYPSSSSKQQQRRQSDVVGSSSSSSPGGVRLQVTLGADVAFLSTNRGSSSHGTDTTLSYVASLKVKTHLLFPLDSPSRRAPVDLVAVLDVGDGMVPPKFQTQKRAIRLLISSLGPNDRLSIIAYSATAKRLLPLRRMNTHGHRSARHVLERLVLGQGAGAASDALRKAAKVLADRRERNPVGSVLLLSDGQRPQQLLQQKGAPQAASRHSSSLACMFSSNTAASGTRFAHLEIPVYGGGGDQLSPPPPHDSSEAAFARCVSGLFSVVAQDAKMELEFAAGAVAGVYSSRGQPSMGATTMGDESQGAMFVLGDLYSEEERELFVELRIPIVARGGETPNTNSESPWLLTARCSYVVPATRELVLSGGDQSFPFPQLQAAVTSEALPQQQQQHHHHRWLHHSLIPRSPRSSSPRPPPCPSSDQLKHQFLTARAITESRRLAESGEYSAAAQVLTTTRSALLPRHTGSGSGSAEEGARALEGELAELQRRRQQQRAMARRRRRSGSNGGGGDRNPADVEAAQDAGGRDTTGGEALTPTSAWRAAERLAKVAMMRKSLNRRVSDLHGFEDARF